MTTVPTVGQHFENECCMEPGKPVYFTPNTHENTLANCSASGQHLAFRHTPGRRCSNCRLSRGQPAGGATTRSQLMLTAGAAESDLSSTVSLVKPTLFVKLSSCMYIKGLNSLLLSTCLNFFLY